MRKTTQTFRANAVVALMINRGRPTLSNTSLNGAEPSKNGRMQRLMAAQTCVQRYASEAHAVSFCRNSRTHRCKVVESDKWRHFEAAQQQLNRDEAGRLERDTEALIDEAREDEVDLAV